MKRLKFAGNDKLFDGNKLKKEVIRYIFDHMEYDGDFNHEKFEHDPNIEPSNKIECQAMGDILWEDLEKKFGPLSSEDRKQLITALNEEDSCYNETMDLLGDYAKDGYSVNTAKYSFQDVFDSMLGYHAEVTKWDYPDTEEVDDSEYIDKMKTRDHNDERYW
jgi:hypothetical protein